MSPSAEPTQAIVQGHTMGFPPTSTHPGNKHREASLSPVDISRMEMSNESGTSCLFAADRGEKTKEGGQKKKDKLWVTSSRRSLKQQCLLNSNDNDLIHYALFH